MNELAPVANSLKDGFQKLTDSLEDVIDAFKKIGNLMDGWTTTDRRRIRRESRRTGVSFVTLEGRPRRYFVPATPAES